MELVEGFAEWEETLFTTKEKWEEFVKKREELFSVQKLKDEIEGEIDTQKRLMKAAKKKIFEQGSPKTFRPYFMH
jgi:hypothetical protein